MPKIAKSHTYLGGIPIECRLIPGESQEGPRGTWSEKHFRSETNEPKRKHVSHLGNVRTTYYLKIVCTGPSGCLIGSGFLDWAIYMFA